MRGSLGEKIGEGTTADIHAWAPGQVVKLLKASASRPVSKHEARMTRAVFAAGGPAPEVLDEVTVEGRFGIVLPRLNGPTLVQHCRSGAVTLEQAGAILAFLALSVHKLPPPRQVPFLRDLIDVFRLSSATIPKHIAIGLPTLFERLRPGDGLCHVDLHPNNVIMTAEGPRLIDWTWTVRAPAAYDLAVSYSLLCELTAAAVDHPERPRAIYSAMQAEYARLAGLSPAALTAAIESYLPIASAFHLLVEAGPAVVRKRLIERVDAALGVAD